MAVLAFSGHIRVNCHGHVDLFLVGRSGGVRRVDDVQRGVELLDIRRDRIFEKVEQVEALRSPYVPGSLSGGGGVEKNSKTRSWKRSAVWLRPITGSVAARTQA